jgi:hypothetical protein
MIEPWNNPRSKFWWFRRRVPTKYRTFGMPAEIKFSLETTDWDEAVLRCQEENLKLERQWRAGLTGTPPTELSHLQIVALAGEFYNETVEAHREEPGPQAAWEDSLSAVADVKSRRILTSQAWLNTVYGSPSVVSFAGRLAEELRILSFYHTDRRFYDDPLRGKHRTVGRWNLQSRYPLSICIYADDSVIPQYPYRARHLRKQAHLRADR